MYASTPGQVYGLFYLLACTALATRSADPVAENRTLPLPHRTISQFPVGTWIENIAVRPNGNLLLTSLSPNASLYEVINPSSASPTTVRHFTIDTVTSLLGITEIATDQFAIVGGNFSSSGAGVKGSYGVWTADFNDQGPPEPKLRLSIPDAVLLNGATSLPSRKGVILIADSTLGLVWRANLVTGRHDVALQYPEMNPGMDNTPAIGINGLHIHSGHLWWTNSAKITLSRIRITWYGSPVRGAKVETMSALPASRLDDFIFGPNDEDLAWVTTNSDSRVFSVNDSGMSVVVAGAADPSTVQGATACAFGRTVRDRMILYVPTAGGMNNGIRSGGKVVALDVTGLSDVHE